MSREQGSRRKAKESARHDKAKGHQTRRTRGGKNRREGIKLIDIRYIQRA
jgi:hypothetical protein